MIRKLAEAMTTEYCQFCQALTRNRFLGEPELPGPYAKEFPACNENCARRFYYCFTLACKEINSVELGGPVMIGDTGNSGAGNRWAIWRSLGGEWRLGSILMRQPSSRLLAVLFDEWQAQADGSGTARAATGAAEVVRCDCENSLCGIPHTPGDCRIAGEVKITEGRLCRPCAVYMPAEYKLEEGGK